MTEFREVPNTKSLLSSLKDGDLFIVEGREEVCVKGTAFCHPLDGSANITIPGSYYVTPVEVLSVEYRRLAK